LIFLSCAQRKKARRLPKEKLVGVCLTENDRTGYHVDVVALDSGCAWLFIIDACWSVLEAVH
jgi:hypothetical protein